VALLSEAIGLAAVAIPGIVKMAGQKRRAKPCVLLQRSGIVALFVSNIFNYSQASATACQPLLKGCHARGRGFESRPPRPLGDKSLGISHIYNKLRARGTGQTAMAPTMHTVSVPPEWYISPEVAYGIRHPTWHAG